VDLSTKQSKSWYGVGSHRLTANSGENLSAGTLMWISLHFNFRTKISSKFRDMTILSDNMNLLLTVPVQTSLEAGSSVLCGLVLLV
jgi:hypothetical protein